MFHAVILAGGVGERFWPLSTRKKPKQLLKLFGSQSMLRQTVDRISTAVSGNIWIITSLSLDSAVRKEIPELDPAKIVAEPVGRNTAPAIGLAAALISREDKDAVITVMPSDHHFPDPDKFIETFSVAKRAAEEERGLVTFGIIPSRAETGYGYIKTGQRLPIGGTSREVFQVDRFVEKPNAENAARYVNSGYLWNSGIFVWRADILLAGLEKHLPDLSSGLREIVSAPETNVDDAVRAFYQGAESVSIDYGLMEKASNTMVVKADFPWDDLGDWASLERVAPLDEDRNVVIGRHLGVSTENSIIVSGDGIVATHGVSDLVIVSTGKVTLVCDKKNAQDVKELVRKLKSLDADLEEFI